jgi:hypothetical protein
MLSFAHKMVIALMLCIAVLIARLDQISSATHPIEKTETASTSKQEGQWEKWGEPLIVVTFLLVVVGLGQLGLFWRQLSFIRESLDDAREAAEAARDSVNAQREDFAATHRPKIRIKHLWITSDISQSTPITVKVVCVNIGTSDALLGAIGIRCHVVGNEYLLPADPGIAHTIPLNGILTCGRNLTIPGIGPADNLNTGYTLAAHEWADIQRRHAKLYCVGWISCLDAAGRMRLTGFCRVLEPPDGHAVVTPGNGRFRVCQHPDYEYQD